MNRLILSETNTADKIRLLSKYKSNINKMLMIRTIESK